MSPVVRMQDPPPMTREEYKPKEYQAHPKTIELMDSMVRMSQERDTLSDECKTLKAELAIEREKTAYLHSELERSNGEANRRIDQLTSDKEFYQRHTTAIVTQLNTVGIIIGQTLDAAKKAADEIPPTKAPINQEKIVADLGEEIAETNGGQ